MSSDVIRSEIMEWASYQLRKIAGCACARNAGNVFPRRRFLRKPLVSDPGMHHGTCVTHVPWCMSGSLTCGDGENVPGIPGACAPAIVCIWQEAHAKRFMEIPPPFLNTVIWLAKTVSKSLVAEELSFCSPHCACDKFIEAEWRIHG